MFAKGVKGVLIVLMILFLVQPTEYVQPWFLHMFSCFSCAKFFSSDKLHKCAKRAATWQSRGNYAQSMNVEEWFTVLKYLRQTLGKCLKNCIYTVKIHGEFDVLVSLGATRIAVTGLFV